MELPSRKSKEKKEFRLGKERKRNSREKSGAARDTWRKQGKRTY